MPDAAEGFAARMRQGRERWVRLDEQREVLIRRPPEVRMPALLRGGDIEQFIDCVVGWRGPGFTEAALLGPKLGSDAPVPFHAEAWREFALDHAAHLAAVATEVAKDCAGYIEAKEAAEEK